MNGSSSGDLSYPIGSLIVGLALLVIGVTLYFLPAIIASRRNHSNASSILILNLFLGWTFLGWVVALIWAFSDNTAESKAASRGPIVWVAERSGTWENALERPRLAIPASQTDEGTSPQPAVRADLEGRAHTNRSGFRTKRVLGLVAACVSVAIVAYILVTEKARTAGSIQEVRLAAPASQAPEKESPHATIRQDVEGLRQSSLNQDFQTYTNGRYGFRVDYPDSFTPQRPPENGDGLALKSEDGRATLVVSGMNNAGFTLKDEYDRSIREAQGQIGFNKMGGSWFVVTWTDGDNLVYTKKFVGPSSQNSFTITFPADQQPQYDSIVTKIEKSFKPGDLGSSH
jgi:Superinfection immunity protein